MTDASPTTDAPRRQIAAFVFLFGISVIANYRGFGLSSSDPAASFSALGVLGFGAALLSAGSRLALVGVAVAGAVVLWLDPSLSNHETLYTTLCATILVTFAVAAVRERSLRVDLAALHETLAAILRLEFLVFYFWVAFHKLNPQFLDERSSCGVHLLERTLAYVPAIPAPDGFTTLVGPLTLFAEASVFGLLLFSRTRWIGVPIAMAFHTLLSVGFPAFQYLVFGFLLLFVPESDLAAAGARFGRVVGARLRIPPRTRAWLGRPLVRVACGVAIALVMNAFYLFARTPGNQLVFGQVTYRLASLLICGVLTLLFIGFVFLARPKDERAAMTLATRLHPALLLLPLAVVFQGAQPYLGIKDVQVFAMFSNLDTSNGQSNHFLIPASWQVSDHLRDPVRIGPGSDRRVAAPFTPKALQETILRADQRPRLAPSYLALQRRVTELARAGAHDIQVEYVRGGRRRVVRNAERDPELAGAGFLTRSYLKTRPIVLANHGPCRW